MRKGFGLRGVRICGDIFKSLVLYQQMVFRLIWRGGLSADFASVMAVEGLMRRSEVRCLYHLAQEAQEEGVIVEIGSYRGLSAVALAKGSLRGARIPVYSIDPHEGGNGKDVPGGLSFDSKDQVAFLKNVLFAGVAHLVKPVHFVSRQAASGWEKPISLLFIDGDHAYPAVRSDVILWSRFVLRGGFAVFHDSTDPAGGPYRVVQEMIREGSFTMIERVEKLSILRKA